MSNLLRTRILWLLLISTPFVNAQQVVKHGVTGIFGDTGTAVFNLKKSTETKSPIKEGPYSFESQREFRQANPQLISQKIRGAYKSNKKHGIWEFENHKTEFKNKGFENGTPKFSKIERNLRAKGNFKYGNPDSDWHILQSTGSDSLLSVRVGFKDGWLNGPFYFSNQIKNIKITGEILQGLLHGQWTLNLGNTKEQRIYERGVLLFLLTTQGTDTLENLVYPISSVCKKALVQKADKNNPLVNFPMSLTFSDGYPKSSKWVTAQQSGNRHLKIVDSLIGVFSPQWKSSVGLSFGTNRCRYPLQGAEVKLLNDWLKKDEIFIESVNRLNDSVQSFKNLNLSIEIALAREWIKKQNQIIEFTRTWRKILENGQLIYYYRNGPILEHVKNWLSSDTISQKQWHYKSDTNSGFLLFLDQNWQKRIQKANSLQDELKSIKSKFHLSREVINLSVEIDRRKTEIRQWIKNLYLDSSIHYREFLKDLDSTYLGDTFQAHLDAFLKETNILKEKKLGQELVYALDTLYAFVEYVVEASRQHAVLDTFYTEVRLDAFTFERYRARIKKRLYSISDRTLQHLYKRGAYSLFNERWGTLKTIQQIQQTLYYLRDANTSLMERRWLKTRDWDKRIALFQIKR